jgi:hypothetical protein
MATVKQKKDEVSVAVVEKADVDVKKIQEAITNVVVLKGVESPVLFGIDRIAQATTRTVSNVENSKNADAGPKGPKGP